MIPNQRVHQVVKPGAGQFFPRYLSSSSSSPASSCRRPTPASALVLGDTFLNWTKTGHRSWWNGLKWINHQWNLPISTGKPIISRFLVNLPICTGKPIISRFLVNLPICTGKPIVEFLMPPGGETHSEQSPDQFWRNLNSPCSNGYHQHLGGFWTNGATSFSAPHVGPPSLGNGNSVYIAQPERVGHWNSVPYKSPSFTLLVFRLPSNCRE